MTLDGLTDFPCYRSKAAEIEPHHRAWARANVARFGSWSLSNRS